MKWAYLNLLDSRGDHFHLPTKQDLQDQDASLKSLWDLNHEEKESILTSIAKRNYTTILTAISSLFFLRTASSNSLRVKRLDISTLDDLREVRGPQLGNLFVNGRDGDKPVITLSEE